MGSKAREGHVSALTCIDLVSDVFTYVSTPKLLDTKFDMLENIASNKALLKALDETVVETSN